jgi:hypothetical protein
MVGFGQSRTSGLFFENLVDEPLRCFLWETIFSQHETVLSGAFGCDRSNVIGENDCGSVEINFAKGLGSLD